MFNKSSYNNLNKKALLLSYFTLVYNLLEGLISIFFGFISYRQKNPFGDARVIWEPSRLQQLITLALQDNEGMGRLIRING